MDQKTIDRLYEDFEISIKPGQGFKYVRTRDILDRLNKTFAGNWGIHVRHHELVDDEVLVLVAVNLYNDEGQVLASQEGFGSAKKFRGVELGNIYKSATSKAIKSAVRNWGIALFLEEDETGSAPSNSVSTTTSRSNSSTPNVGNTPQGMPSNNTPPSMGMPNNMPASTGMPKMMAPSEVPPVPPVSPVATVMPPSNVVEKEKPKVNTMGTVPQGQTPLQGPPSNTVAQKTMPPTGSLPTMVAVPGQVPVSKDNSDINVITAVQKVAIASRLGAKSLTFDQVAPDFYATRTTQAPENIDGMLYQDALDMVAYLNTK